jgi:hypothetical protein
MRGTPTGFGRRYRRRCGSPTRIALRATLGAAAAITAARTYGWIPHNAGFDFLDIASSILGQINF